MYGVLEDGGKVHPVRFDSRCSFEGRKHGRAQSPVNLRCYRRLIMERGVDHECLTLTHSDDLLDTMPCQYDEILEVA